VTDIDPRRRQAARPGKAKPSRPPAKAAPSRPPPAKPKARLRHYRRAQHDRGAETRARLIEAALDVFGRLGLDGATTREIARRAGVNLAAIVYHFGGKEALHLAVAEHIVGRIATLLQPVFAELADADSATSPAAAREALTHILDRYVDVLLGSADAERWSRFIVREQMQPTRAFETIERFMGGAHALATRLVATALGRPEDEEVRLRVFTMIGQILVFRVAQALVLGRMGWKAIGAAERAKIKQVVGENIAAMVAPDGVKGR
jgi:AcrR family transcriptional regulator